MSPPPKTHLKIEVHRSQGTGGTVEIRFSGMIAPSSIKSIEKEFRNLLEEKRYQVVLNCEDLHFISSEGMGIFLWFLGELEKNKGSLKFSNVQKPKVRDTMEQHGLFDLFELEKDKNEIAG